ncbi:uncharacterized protein JCM15063_002224 [Sporobolomyces koalae]|uniref:uncharacterized protein n=1 Tax=Sporobolomyces koalae TaxID=500713 RepID=UPI003172CD8A
MSAVPPAHAAQARQPSKQLVVILVVGMLLTGCSNSLWSKYQDMQCVANCDAQDPAARQNFEQPVWQTANMFLGEMCCLVAFSLINSRLNPFRSRQQRRKAVEAAQAREAALASSANRLGSNPLSRPEESAFAFTNSAISLQPGQDLEAGRSPLLPNKPSKTNERAASAEEVEPRTSESKMSWKEAAMFWGPSCCDIAGTTAMNAGLILVPVSVFQMLRGALVLWVGVFSVLFLNRKLDRAQWTALGVCMLGVAVVGSSSLIGPKPVEATVAEDAAAVSPLVGVLLILLAQIFTATQFVLEERIMEHHSVEPLLAAGYEGFFGLITTLAALLLVYRVYGSTPAGQGGYFDMRDGWDQIVQHPRVWQSSIIIAISIALFNFCGLAVTRNVSATARSTIDTCRTLGIWLVSLYLGWESFKLLQVVGFALLVYGTFVFNSITRFPTWTNLHPDHEVVVVPAASALEEEQESLLGYGSRSDSEEEDHLERNRSRGNLRPTRSKSATRGEQSALLKRAD